MFTKKLRTIWFSISGAVTAAAIAAILFFGIPLSIDFTGGSITEVQFTDGRPALADVTTRIEALALGEVSVREAGDANIVIRSRTLTPDEHQQLVTALTFDGTEPITELRFNSIGPSLGNELATKTFYALVVVTLAIMVYVAWAFRRVSRPVPSWVYGIAVVAVLVHDVLVTTGFYAVLAHFTGAQFDVLFAIALLATLGYSVNDTIVIFDRVRENLSTNEHRNIEEPFESTVSRAVYETLGRSINTSVTVALALIALIVFGGEATFNFALALFAGVVAGTYSSILIAAPLLIPFGAYFAKKHAERDAREAEEKAKAAQAAQIRPRISDEPIVM